MSTTTKPETTAERCEAILRRMLELANADEQERPVGLVTDFGDFTATVVARDSHTHVGIPGDDGSWEQFVSNLYDVLHGGPGLSWA